MDINPQTLALLQKPVEEKLAYFQSYKAAHPRLVETTETLLSSIEEPAGALFIFVYGPTGIGKTTMRLRVEQKIISQLLPTLEKDVGRIPICGVEAIGATDGKFNWKDYFTRALMALEEPNIENKVNYHTWGIARDQRGKLLIKPTTPATELHRVLENALLYRRPKAFFIDEAQHMQKMASGRRLQDNMDCLKSIANLTGVVHVLIGTYELLTFRNLSAQLSRRTIDIHFPRYRASCASEVEAFINVLWTFQKHLPLEDEPDLLSNWEYFYAGSLGCVGILKDWLTRALLDALSSRAKTLTLTHLERRAWSVAQLETMLKEIISGEQQLTEDAHKRQQLYGSLGLGDKKTSQLDTVTNQAQELQTSSTAKQKRQRSVCKRNPKRDKVMHQESS
jgi:AAA domain